jgi:hypothetical protein
MPGSLQRVSRERQATPSGTVTRFGMEAAYAIRFAGNGGDSVFSAHDLKDQETPRLSPPTRP